MIGIHTFLLLPSSTGNPPIFLSNDDLVERDALRQFILELEDSAERIQHASDEMFVLINAQALHLERDIIAIIKDLWHTPHGYHVDDEHEVPESIRTKIQSALQEE